jgi:hypothetical protein
VLFGVLDPEIFTVLSGPNRRLNAKILLKVYVECFRSDFRFPSQAELVGVIYAGLAEHGELWRDDDDLAPLDDIAAPKGRRFRRRRRHETSDEATSVAMVRARQLYGRLVDTGWLSETRFGLRTTVAMPAGALRLAELLCNLDEGVAEPLGGLIVEVRNALNAVRLNAAESALGLNKAARDATAFARYLRSVLAMLQDVDRQVLNSTTLAERLHHYFDDFVERVLLRDYATILTTSHPYRFRRRILETLQQVEDSPSDLSAIAQAYLDARLTSDIIAAQDLVQDDLDKIRRVFDSIDEAFERIQQHRSRLELRLRNTVRFAGRRVGVFLERSEALIQRLDRLQALPDQHATLAPRGLLWTQQTPLAAELMARPRGPRSAVTGGAIVLVSNDPIWELRRDLEQRYLERLTVRPAQVLRFLERRVPPFGQGEAADLSIETIDDFLAFDALRQAANLAIAGVQDDTFTRRLLEHFRFAPSSLAVTQNAWLRCSGFQIRRIADHVTLEDELAA